MEIYSMYDDRSSWPNDGPIQDMSRATESPYRSIGHSSRTSSAYYTATAKSQRSSYSVAAPRISAVSTASRSSSGGTSSPYVGIEEDISSDYHNVLPPKPLPKPPQMYSRSGSSHANSDGANEPEAASQSRYLSPSPPQSRPSSARSHTSSGLNGHTTAPQRLSHGPPSEHASLTSPSSHLSRPASQTTGTSTSPRLLSKKRSDLSITPSAGEDPDSFHVRSTYAQLDILGVKGDGIDEGVERTRARVGGSRESELQAMNAVGDEDEKRRDLSPQEVQMLASLDRYGFFAAPSHDRFVLLPATPLLKPLSHISRADTSASENATILPSLPPPRTPIHEEERMKKWGRMLVPRSRDVGGNIQTWAIDSEKEHKLARRAFKGIPDRWRSAAWLAFIGKFAHADKDQLIALSIEYREALEKHSPYDIQIDLDVPRTINGHVLFHTRYGLGQRSLFHVLHSFSLRCNECGYCQGMGPIASMLLCYMAPERAYASLVHLHDAYHMHDIFSPGFPGLLESIYVQERITEEMMPEVYAAFKKHIISTTSYATKWYITLFANSIPYQTHLRLWDAFLLEGPDLFIIVAVSIIWVHRDRITSESANFETVLSLLSSFFVPEDEDVYLNWIAKVAENKKMRTKMQSWRAALL
ncbi:rab-GTPase-TBC domain-containing protein [Russula aff. rugulosa BPL654]|nr:rab-GTPase-TBC domain-containing protein [Russula aff. rugulosa BPL654]